MGEHIVGGAFKKEARRGSVGPTRRGGDPPRGRNFVKFIKHPAKRALPPAKVFLPRGRFGFSGIFRFSKPGETPGWGHHRVGAGQIGEFPRVV